MVFKRHKNRTKNVCIINNNEKEEIEELILPISMLRFCSDQLQNLNYIFTKNALHEQDTEFTKSILLATSVTERLIQRLVCGIGMLDSRFSSKFLIALHDSKVDNASPSLEYLLRLDSLSQPTLYATDEIPKYSISESDVENCPPGYARIRLHPPCSKTWTEFINPMGYLRRDKIQTRVVELLAMAASGTSPISSLQVDETVLCGSPGKVVDAFTLHTILQKPADQQIFYGDAGKNPRFPDPRDFKLAIVDKPNGICLRIGFISSALAPITINVRLLIGIGLDAWPSSSNFPFRIPLSHSDCVLYYRAAQTGMFVVGYGVHSTAWQIRVPAAESFLEQHYNTSGVIAIIVKTLCGIPRDIDEEYKRHQVVYRILNSYTMRSCMFYSLEGDLTGPTEIILNWSPSHISTIVLKILDKLIKALRDQDQPNYFFRSNLFVNPGHLCADDFLLESNKIKAYMLKLFDMSLTSLSTNEGFCKYLVMQKIEMNLLRKWKDLIDGLVPPPSVQSGMCCRRFKRRNDVLNSQYTSRQVEYIGIVLKNMLMVKHAVLQTPDEAAWATILKLSDHFKENAIEDIIYILATLIEQARDEYMKRIQNNYAHPEKQLPKIIQKIENSISSLIELMRKENDVAGMDLVNDNTLVNIILKWLHKGLDYNKKYLKRVLQPYIKKLYVTSHGASFHLEAIKRKEILDECDSLGLFASLVNSGRITPAQGLVDAAVKNWTWAKNMLEAVEEGQLRLLFIPERGKCTKHILCLPPNEKSNFSKSMHDLKSSDEYSTLNKKQCYLSTSLLSAPKREESGSAIDFKPPHCYLRDTSAMRLTFSRLQRHGEHRCHGDVLATLLAMHKVNVVREVSTLLPDEERLEIMEAIQKLQNERNRRFSKKSNANTLIQMKTIKKSNSKKGSSEDLERYTPTEESAGVQDGEPTRPKLEKRQFASKRWAEIHTKDNSATLIGSCRAARIREDTSIIQFQDNFKVRSLMKHSSFKY